MESKLSTVEIVTELTILEQEINLKIMKYNLLSQVIRERYPDLERDDYFLEKKILTDTKTKWYNLIR